MDGGRFDELAKVLAAGASRRRLLRVIAASLAASFVRVTPSSGVAPTAATDRPTVEYFALGDSIASGHGLMDDGTSCHRSGLSYPYKVLDALGERYEIRSVRHLACSGATAGRPSDPEDAYHWFRNQVRFVIDHLEERSTAGEGDERTEPLTLVSITIGANDFRFLHWSILFRLVQFVEGFTAWVDETTASVVREMRRALSDLLQFPGVRVVITEYPNPINRDSIIFRLRPNPLSRPCGDLYGALSCYERTERAIHNLNSSLGLDVHARLSPEDQQRVRVVPVHAAFHRDGGREGPGLAGAQESVSGLCGVAPPGLDETWIQYPGDPLSNSEIGIAGVTFAKTGDCFHPRERGAEEIARLVTEAALDLLGLPHPAAAPTPEIVATEPPDDGCPAGMTRCGQSCVDLGQNGLHCGSCGNRCGVFEVCCTGVCGCPESAAMFPGACAPGAPVC